MSKPSFRIGFELEGLVRHGSQATFDEGLRSINADIDRGTDGSVNGYFSTSARDILNMWTSERTAGNGIEIRTPVLSLDKGLALFEEILGYLADQSQAGIFKTNGTCGLHVNISEKSMSRSNARFCAWYAHLVAAFPEHEVLAMFRRTNNTYCLPLFERRADEKNPDTILNRVLNQQFGTGKYHALALHRNVDPDLRRVEFRCLGNTNYHLRHIELARALDAIIVGAEQAYEAVVDADKDSFTARIAAEKATAPMFQALFA